MSGLHWSLVKSVFDNSPAGTSKTRLQTLKDDIAADKAAIKPVIDAIKPQIDAAKAAVTNMAVELGTSPFTFEAAGRAATELAFVLIAFDAAMDVIADTLAASVVCSAWKNDAARSAGSTGSTCGDCSGRGASSDVMDRHRSSGAPRCRIVTS